MSEEQLPGTSEVSPAPAPPAPTPPVSCFAAFHEKAVFVQLRVEMVGVTYPNAPVLSDSGEPLGTKMLRGQCIVHPTEPIIELRTSDPLHPQLLAIVLIPKDLIAYMTRIDPPSQPVYSR
jgi:hypothetical protein